MQLWGAAHFYKALRIKNFLIRASIRYCCRSLQNPHHPDRQRHPVLSSAQIPQRPNSAVDHAYVRSVLQRVGIEHRLTKPKHPRTNGQVERMNRMINDATVKKYYYQSHDKLKKHLHTFLMAYDFARRLKVLKGLTAYEYVCKV